LAPWQRLLHRAVDGLSRLRSAGQQIPEWTLGGGTALMIRTGHRISKDIDAFIDDPQYLSFLSPRLAGEDVWACEAYEESANHLRLIFPEGEIDFIVAAAITNLASEPKRIVVNQPEVSSGYDIQVEHPVEISIKKLAYRGSMLKVRDIFDISVVDALYGDLLRANLHYVAHLKPAILARLDGIPEDYLHLELAELDISENWRVSAMSSRHRVRELIAVGPD
jgi:nucleotidyltransferase AbiEii toxin of type IV toxin-antitoxin system